MSCLSKTFSLWVPVLIFKSIAGFFKFIWKINLWILQKISGVPLYYCKPEYRIPALIFGSIGVIFSINIIFYLLILVSSHSNNASPQSIGLSEFMLISFVSVSLLIVCRLLVKRGSI